MAKTSAFLTGGRTHLLGVSMGGNTGTNDYPNSAMYWGTATPGWPGGDLDCYNRHKTTWGRPPDAIRVYSSNIGATTGVNGTGSGSGTYGFFSTDWRSIANDGAAIVVTFKDGAPTGWQGLANDLNAAGSNATKTRYLNFCQNLRRWHNDTSNTASIKKILLGMHHEAYPDGTAASYVAWWQAVVNFLLDNGIGYGPKPSTGHGSNWSGTWYDMIEWTFVPTGSSMGTAAGKAYYPGDPYVTWALTDSYSWGGGQHADTNPTHTASEADTAIHNGEVPQPGMTISSSHYSNAWRTMQETAQTLVDWYKAGPGGSRDVLLGFGEFGPCEDIDRFTISGGQLALPQTHTGIPHLKGDWFTGAAHWLRQETWTAPNADNNIVSADLSFGGKFQLLMFWNSEEASVRYWNTIPFQPGDTTHPTTSGAAAHYGWDKFIAFANDDIFGGTPTNHIPPSITSFTDAHVDGGDAGDYTFSVVATTGDSAITTYFFDFGDGTTRTVSTANLTVQTAHSYATNGRFTATVTITDTNALTVQGTVFVIVAPPTSPYALAPYVVAGDQVVKLRATFNTAVDALEAYSGVGGGSHATPASGASLTLQDPRYYRYQDVTLSASCAFTLPAAVAGMVLRVTVRQAAVGGGYTASWTAANTIRWPGGSAPTMTATAASSDDYEFVCVTDGYWRGRRVAADVR